MWNLHCKIRPSHKSILPLAPQAFPFLLPSTQTPISPLQLLPWTVVWVECFLPSNGLRMHCVSSTKSDWDMVMAISVASTTLLSCNHRQTLLLSTHIASSKTIAALFFRNRLFYPIIKCAQSLSHTETPFHCSNVIEILEQRGLVDSITSPSFRTSCSSQTLRVCCPHGREPLLGNLLCIITIRKQLTWLLLRRKTLLSMVVPWAGLVTLLGRASRIYFIGFSEKGWKLWGSGHKEEQGRREEVAQGLEFCNKFLCGPRITVWNGN